MAKRVTEKNGELDRLMIREAFTPTQWKIVKELVAKTKKEAVGGEGERCKKFINQVVYPTFANYMREYVPASVWREIDAEFKKYGLEGKKGEKGYD